MIIYFYGTGLRMNELKYIKLCDIDSKNFISATYVGINPQLLPARALHSKWGWHQEKQVGGRPNQQPEIPVSGGCFKAGVQSHLFKKAAVAFSTGHFANKWQQYRTANKKGRL